MAAMRRDRAASSSSAGRGRSSSSSSVLAAVPAAAALLAASSSTPLPAAHAYPTGVGSCARGFFKFPPSTRHNSGGNLNDNWGDLASYGLTVLLDDVPLLRPSGGDQYHYSGTCGPDRRFLCGRCQGNCMGDGDCEGGLRCMIRDGTVRGEDEDVPGCEGWQGYWTGTNYCYDPADDDRRRGLLQGRRNGGGHSDRRRAEVEDGTRRRELQGQRGAPPSDAPAFLAGSTYRLRLKAPSGRAFRGFLFRLEGYDGQDLGDVMTPVEDYDDADADDDGGAPPVQILASAADGAAEGNGMNAATTCESTVSAACHAEGSKKSYAEAIVAIPAGASGRANLEVTAMVGKERWYLTSYDIAFEAPPDIGGGGDGDGVATTTTTSTTPSFRSNYGKGEGNGGYQSQPGEGGGSTSYVDVYGNPADDGGARGSAEDVAGEGTNADLDGGGADVGSSSSTAASFSDGGGGGGGLPRLAKIALVSVAVIVSGFVAGWYLVGRKERERHRNQLAKLEEDEREARSRGEAMNGGSPGKISSSPARTVASYGDAEGGGTRWENEDDDSDEENDGEEEYSLGGSSVNSDDSDYYSGNGTGKIL